MQNAVLCAIPMMNIQIHNGHPSEASICRTRVRRSDRHIIQQTEPLRNRRVVRIGHCSAGSDVVARRSHDAKNVPNFGIRQRGLVQLIDRRTHGLRGSSGL